MSEMQPGELSPDGKLRLRDPVELGWEVVNHLAEVIELPIKEEPEDIVA